MATRNRTKQYMRFRDANVARSGPVKRAGMSKSLLAADQLDENEAGLSADVNDRTPPEWIRYVDDARAHMATINDRLKELIKLHAGHLKVEFDDDIVSEQKVEICTAEIQRQLQLVQKSLVRLAKVQGLSGQEQKLRNNMCRELGAELQAVSTKFRQKQKSYLSKLQALQSRSDQIFSFGDGVDPLGADFVDKGMSDGQLSQVKEINHQVDVRNQEIVDVAKSIEELAHLFQDLSLLVIEQGTVLDRIDYNIEQTATHTQEAVVQLRQAAKSQKAARKKICMILLCLMVGVVILVMFFKGI